MGARDLKWCMIDFYEEAEDRVTNRKANSMLLSFASSWNVTISLLIRFFRGDARIKQSTLRILGKYTTSELHPIPWVHWLFISKSDTLSHPWAGQSSWAWAGKERSAPEESLWASCPLLKECESVARLIFSELPGQCLAVGHESVVGPTDTSCMQVFTPVHYALLIE
jgi:hypothetical protein